MLTDAWTRVVSWFETHARDELPRLRGPAHAKDVAAVEAAMGMPLPAAMVAWYGRNDGAAGASSWLAGYDWLPLSGALAVRASWIEAGVAPPATWLPIGDAHGGVGYVVDVASGAVLEVDRRGNSRVLAPNVDAFLELYARELEAGHYVYTHEGLVHRDFEGSGMLGRVAIDIPSDLPAFVKRLASFSREPTAAEWSTLRGAPPDELLAALVSAGERATPLIAVALGSRGEEWARSLLGGDRRPQSFAQAVQVAAACLPPEEALRWAWSNLPPRSGSDIAALEGLGSQLLLDRMETERDLGAAPEWARAAFGAGLDWPRAKRWIAGGRPLSLIALDALAVPATSNPPQRPIPVVVDELRSVLDAAVRADPTARVKKAVAKITELYG